MSISVLMSVYKSEKEAYLNKALQSVWDDQTLKPDEIVLIEDGYLGDTLYGVIASWKEKLGDKLIILQNKNNVGLTKSLNRGLKFVKGTYIARMDSDDISMPQRFEKQAKFLDDNKDIAVVGGYLQEFNSSCSNLNVRKYPLTPEKVIRYIHKASPLAHPTVMMRREIFENGVTYDERYRTSQDIALWFEVLSKGYRIANLNVVTLKFRRDNGIYKRRSREKAKNEFLIYMGGIRKLNGLLSIKYIYPVARYLFRLMPVPVVRLIYSSRLRTEILRSGV